MALRSDRVMARACLPGGFWKTALWITTALGMGFWLWRPIRFANDLWWHLAVGRYMVEHRTIPLYDVFSSTAHGQRWINHEWLFQGIVYGFYWLAGLNGILLLKILLIGLSIALQWDRLRRNGVGWPLQWLTIAAMFWISRYGWNERADLVSVLFLSGLLYTLDDCDRQGKITPFFVAWPLLFVFWANSHGGFVLGLALGALWLSAALVEGRFPRRPLVLWWIACFGATFLNPNIYHLHVSTWEALRLLQAGFFTEWQRTPWHPLEGFWGCLVLFWLVFGAHVRENRRIPWTALTVGLLLSWGAVHHVRNVPYFMVGAFGYVALWLGQRPLGRVFDTWIRDRGWKGLASALGLTLLFDVQAAAGMRGGVQKDMFPIEACEFIRRERLPAVFYNEYGFGGYWMWAFGTDRPVFIDGRFHTVESYTKLYREAVHAQASPPEIWQRFLDQHGIGAALLSYPEPMISPPVFRLYFPRSHWALIYWDDVALIFVRRVPAFQPWIRQYEFGTVDPEGTFEHLRRQADRSREKHRLLTADLERNVRLHPESRRARMLLNLCRSFDGP